VDVDVDVDVDVETLPGQAGVCMFTKGTLHGHPLPANATPTPLSHHSHPPQPLSLFIPGRGPARFTKLGLLSAYSLHVSARVGRARA
jgi:hypothetical protein